MRRSPQQVADISRLDNAENATLNAEHQRTKSYNVNDTGYFSLSTLEAVSEKLMMAGY